MIDWKKVETVIFDLGRVLITVDFTRGLFKYYKRDAGSSDEEVLAELFHDPVFVGFNSGELSPHQVYHTLTEKYALPVSYDRFTHEWCDIFGPMDGMDSFVKQVSQSYQVGLLSDIDPLHWAYCRENFQFLSLFEKPALSFEIGALKPDPRCYMAAARNTETNPENCLFIDDRDINVHGAQAAGMQAIQFTGVGQLTQIFRDSKL